MNVVSGCLFTDSAYTFKDNAHFMRWLGQHKNRSERTFLDKDFAKGIDVVIATLESRLIVDKAVIYMTYSRINSIGENLIRLGYSATYFKTGIDGVLELVYIFNRNFKPA
jgi:hypothetical protein